MTKFDIPDLVLPGKPDELIFLGFTAILIHQTLERLLRLSFHEG